MLMKKAHEIDRLSLKVNGKLSSEFYRFIQDELEKTLLKYFDKHFPSDKILTIKRIELDLGTLTSGKYFNQEFIVRLSYLLDTELAKFFKDTSNITLIESNIAISAIENFIHYLKTGFSKVEGVTLSTLFEELLNDNLNYLRGIIESTKESETQYQRLLYQVPFSLLERYWKKVYPGQYELIFGINQQILNGIESRLKDSNSLSLLKEALKKNTFLFLTGQVSNDDVVLVYLLFLRNNYNDFETLFPKTGFNLFEEFYQDRLPVRGTGKPASEKDALDAILFYSETGRFNKVASGLSSSVPIQNLSRQDISTLASKLLADQVRFKSKIKRLFSTLTSQQIQWLLVEIGSGASKGLASRVDNIVYLRKTIKSVFSVDILTFGRLVISEYLTISRQDKVEDLFVLDELLKLIAAKKGNSKSDIANKLSAKLTISFYKEAKAIKEQLKTLQTVSDDFNEERKPSADILETFLYYLRTGVWNLARTTPADILKQLLNSSADRLTAQLNRFINNQTVWLRLIHHHPVDLVRILVDKVFESDSSLVILNNLLDSEIVTADRIVLQRRMLESFIVVKNQIEENAQDQFLILFEQRINELFPTDNQDGSVPVRLYSQEKDAVVQQQELAEIYILSFIHFIKYKRHIYSEVEVDGFLPSLDKILNNWLGEFLKQLSKEPDAKQLVAAIFDRLDESDLNRIFLAFVPEYKVHFDSMLESILYKYAIKKNELLSSWLIIHLLHDAPLDHEEFATLLIKELGAHQEDLAVLPFAETTIILADIEDTDLLNSMFRMFLHRGIAAAYVHEFNVFDLLQEVIRSGKFPRWSLIHSKRELLILFNEVAEYEPALLDHLFNEHLKSSVAIQNLLFFIQYDGFLSLLEKLGTKPVATIKQVVEGLVAAHLDLADQEALRTYFFSKYITAFYSIRNADVDQLANSVLQVVPADFGLSTMDYLAIISEDPSPVIRNYVLGLRNALDVNEYKEENIEDIDLLLAVMLEREVPWWEAEQMANNLAIHGSTVESLILDSMINQPERIITSIRNTGVSDEIYNRILPFVSSAQFFQIIQTIAPKQASVMISFDRLLTFWNTSLDRYGWRTFVLEYLIETRASHLDVTLLITDSLNYVSKATGIQLPKIARQLSNELVKHPLSESEFFLKVFSAWNVSNIVKKERDDHDGLSEYLTAFTYYLKTGSFSAGMLTEQISDEKLIQYIQKQVSGGNTAIRKSIAEALLDEQVQLRILNEEAEPILLLLVDTLYATSTQKLYEYKALAIEFIQDQWAFLSKRLLSQWFYKTALALLSDIRYANVSEEELTVNYILQVYTDFNLVSDLTEEDFVKYKFSKKITRELLAYEAKSEYAEEINTNQDNVGNAIRYYLATGLLPVHMLERLTTSTELVRELQNELSRGNKMIKDMIPVALKSEAVRLRIIKNERPSFLSLLVGVLYPASIQKLEFYKENAFQFFREQGVSGADLVLLNQLYYRTVFDHYYTNKNTNATGEQLILNFINTIPGIITSTYELRFDDLFNYRFAPDILDQLDQRKNVAGSLNEVVKNSSSGNVILSDPFLASLVDYLQSGTFVDRTTAGISSLHELMNHLQQQVRMGNRILQRIIVNALRKEPIRMRVVSKESSEFCLLLLAVIHPMHDQKLSILKDNVIRLIKDQNASLSETALTQIFFQTSFEAILDNEYVAVEELVFQFIKNSTQVVGVTLNLKADVLQRYGFNHQLQKLILANSTLDATFKFSNESLTSNENERIDSLDSASRSYDFMNALDRYLQTGLLSVNYATRVIGMVQLTRFIHQQASKGDQKLTALVISSLREEKIRLRVIDVERDDFLFLLLSVIYPAANQKLNLLKTNAIRLLQDQHSSLTERGLSKLFFTHAFEFVLDQKRGQAVIESLVITFIKKVLKDLDHAMPLDTTVLQRYGFSSTMSAAIINSVQDELPVSDIELISSSGSDAFAAGGPDWNVRQNIDLLIHLALHEEVPWWALKRKSFQDIAIDSLIDHLAFPIWIHYPKEIIASINETGESYRIYQRLLPSFSQEQLEQIVVKLASSFGHFINSFTSLVMAWRGTIQRVNWWSFVLDYLHRDRSFNAGKFIASSQSYLSEALRVNKEKVRKDLLRVAEQQLRNGELRYAPFPGLLESKNNLDDSIAASAPTILPAWDLETALAYYLKTGSLPRGVLPFINSYDAFVGLVRKQLYLGLEEISNVMINALLDEKIRLRLISKEQSSFLFVMLGAVYPNQERQLKIYKSTITQFFRSQLPSFELSAFDDLFFQTMFDPMGKDTYAPLTSEKLIISFIIKASEAFDLRKGFYSAMLLRSGFKQDIIHELIKSNTRFLKEDRSSSNKPAADEQLDHRVQIKNAGLVIVSPYLTRYFDLLAMTKDSKFKTEEDAVRAVHLLQYLATGFASAPEHELVLNKILCGVKLSTPVPIEITLTDTEKEITNSLLKGVLQNWEKLKNSSVQALQEGFMIRAGVIYEKEDNWQLKVEKKTLDILMESMPWSFSTIKLPWMEKRLLVQWL